MQSYYYCYHQIYYFLFVICKLYLHRCHFDIVNVYFTAITIIYNRSLIVVFYAITVVLIILFYNINFVVCNVVTVNTNSAVQYGESVRYLANVVA